MADMWLDPILLIEVLPGHTAAEDPGTPSISRRIPDQEDGNIYVVVGGFQSSSGPRWYSTGSGSAFCLLNMVNSQQI